MSLHDNTPKMTLHTFLAIINKTAIKKLTHDELKVIHSDFSKIEGFGTSELVDVIDAEGNTFSSPLVSKPQILMLSSKLNNEDRYKLIVALDKLDDSELALKRMIVGKLDPLRHEYKEKRSFVEIYRPLVNLMIPSIDNEFFDATHFQFTRVFNRTNNTNFTCFQLKERMVQKGILKKNHERKKEKLLRDISHTVELPNDETISSRTLMYRLKDMQFLLTYLN